MSLIRKNIKNILLAVVTINQYMLKIHLVRLLSMIEEIGCSKVMKKHFNKELVLPKKDYLPFVNSSECWI